MADMDSLSSEKRKATIIQNYGSWENYVNEMKKAGRPGGLKSRGGAFKDREFASEQGKKGVIAMRNKQRQQIIKELEEEGLLK